MSSQKISCFLPCRKGSERVPKKNIKRFVGFEFGLVQLKLRQLLAVNEIDEIVLSTNDDDILSFAHSIQDSRLRIHNRIDELSSSKTSTDQLVGHALDLIPEGHIVWTHVTSPFITAEIYQKIIEVYKKKLSEGFDSLMTVTPQYSFLWGDCGPLNYSRDIEKWPRTQTLTPIYEINSGAFICSSGIYSNFNDRIGKKPYLYELDKLVSHDIDWPEDFVIAECMAEKGIVQL